MATKAADKNDKAPELPPGSTTHPAGTAGIPDKPEGGGKAEKRLFGVGKEKVWLTKGEAEKAGKFWKD